MSNVIPFDFQGMNVRVITGEDGEPWFVATDISKILEYRSASDMTRNLDDDEKGTRIVRTPGGEQNINVINESGLYSAILKSRKKEAKRFKKWVVGEVLPSIRKTGSYQAPVTREQQLAQAVMLANEVMEEQKALIEEQSKKIEEDFSEGWIL